MVSFLRRYDYIDIRLKLLFLYGLNIIDLLFTKFLVGTGFFSEGNPIMAYFMSDPITTVLFKLVMPAVLIAALAMRLRTATPEQRRSSNYLAGVLLSIYAAVAVLHVVLVIVYYVMCF